jgi:hypothetical protein
MNDNGKDSRDERNDLETGPEPGRFERLVGGTVAAAGFTAGWAVDRTRDAFADAVGRILYGETSSPEQQNVFTPDYGPAPYEERAADAPAQEARTQEAERETREQERGMDR